MSRNNCRISGFSLSPVEDFTIFAGFSCLDKAVTDRDLEDFLHQDAEKHFRDRIAITYALLADANPQSPIGFVTLQNDAIIVTEEGCLPEVADYAYKAFPAVKIGRLGIKLELQQTPYHFGSLLLSMVKLLMTTDNRTGCRFLTVDAWRNKKQKIDASRFYAQNGFSILASRQKTSNSIPMYYDLALFKNPFGEWNTSG